MNDGRREQHRNGLRRFKTRQVCDEMKFVTLCNTGATVKEVKVDLFEDINDPDNFITYNVEELSPKVFFESYVLHLN